MECARIEYKSLRKTRKKRGIFGSIDPFRVGIEFIPDFTPNESKPIPLGFLLGRVNNEEGVKVEPYLRNL